MTTYIYIYVYMHIYVCIYKVDCAYCDIGSSQTINATHVFAELRPVRVTISVIVSNKKQGMDHFMQQCLKQRKPSVIN